MGGKSVNAYDLVKNNITKIRKPGWVDGAYLQLNHQGGKSLGKYSTFVNGQASMHVPTDSIDLNSREWEAAP